MLVDMLIMHEILCYCSIILLLPVEVISILIVISIS